MCGLDERLGIDRRAPVGYKRRTRSRTRAPTRPPDRPPSPAALVTMQILKMVYAAIVFKGVQGDIREEDEDDDD